MHIQVKIFSFSLGIMCIVIIFNISVALLCAVAEHCPVFLFELLINLTGPEQVIGYYIILGFILVVAIISYVLDRMGRAVRTANINVIRNMNDNECKRHLMNIVSDVPPDILVKYKIRF